MKNKICKFGIYRDKRGKRMTKEAKQLLQEAKEKVEKVILYE